RPKGIDPAESLRVSIGYDTSVIGRQYIGLPRLAYVIAWWRLGITGIVIHIAGAEFGEVARRLVQPAPYRLLPGLLFGTGQLRYILIRRIHVVEKFCLAAADQLLHGSRHLVYFLPPHFGIGGRYPADIIRISTIGSCRRI